MPHALCTLAHAVIDPLQSAITSAAVPLAWTLVASVALILIYVFYTEVLRRCLVHKKAGKVVLITGCDTGFGNLAAKYFSKQGVIVFAGCLSAQSAARLEAESKGHDGRIVGLVMDVTKPEDVDAAVERISVECGGELWAVINNAGIGIGFLVDMMPLETIRKVMEVNFFGLVDVTKKCLPLLKASRGRVINVASVAGRLGPPNLAAYAASKHAVEAFSDSLRQELYIFGLKVCVIEPSFMKTPILTTGLDHVRRMWADTPAAVRDQYGDKFFEELMERAVTLSHKEAEDPMKVVYQYENATFSKIPKDRYLVGVGARFIFWWLAKMPAFIQDPFIRVRFLRNTALPAVMQHRS